MQEAAQFLSGEGFPQAMLSSLLAGADLPSSTIGLVNLTPYDGYLESTCLAWSKQHKQKVKCICVSTKANVVEWCEQKIAMKLMEAMD